VSRVIVSTVIDRSPDEVWADVRDIASHASWMQDAEAIRFVTDHTEGIGTRFECDTKVGPFRLTDHMEITAWDEAERMGVVHRGIVTGTGEFTLEPTADGQTRFRWEEELRFPWWMGGRLGEAVGAPVLRAIWRGNLRRLKSRLER
jgi:uncharacterized protein YndB with AHSA1/START domain